MIEGIYQEDFKKQYEVKFTRKPILEFFEKNNVKNLGAAYHLIQKSDFLSFDKFQALILDQSKQNKQHQKKDHSPMLLYTSLNPFDEQFDDYFFYEITEEITQERKKGKVEFLSYLVSNYDIQINGHPIKYLNRKELELYQAEIAEFFSSTSFQNVNEKEIMSFISKILQENNFN